jgi:hypothetical protein
MKPIEIPTEIREAVAKGAVLAISISRGNMNDVLNGVKHNPEIADEMQKLEIETGFTFKQNFSITDAKNRLQAIENQTIIS